MSRLDRPDHRVSCRISGLILLGFIVSSMCSCIPTRFQETPPFSGKLPDGVIPGETTKNQIQEQLRAAGIDRMPNQVRGGRWWAYEALRGGGEWLVLLPYLARPYYYFPYDSTYFLLLGFDSEDVLEYYAVVTEKNPCDLSFEICYVRELFRTGGTFIRLADTGSESVVEAFEPPSGQCGLYVYSTRPDNGPINLDNVRVGYLLGETAYHYQAIQPGPHTIRIGSWFSGPPISFECIDAELVFARPTWDGGTRLVRDGRRTVQSQRLATEYLRAN